MTSLRARLKRAKIRAAKYKAALTIISQCNCGEGFMPELAQKALQEART